MCTNSHTQPLSLKTDNFISEIATAYFENLCLVRQSVYYEPIAGPSSLLSYQSTFQSLYMAMYFSKQCKNTYNIMERIFQICQQSEKLSKIYISVIASCLCTHLRYPYPWTRSLCFKHRINVNKK